MKPWHTFLYVFFSLINRVTNSSLVKMTSVIGTPYARAPRNVRSKNPQLLLKNKETTAAGACGIFQNSNSITFHAVVSIVLINGLLIVSDVVSFMEKFIELVQSTSPDKDLRPAVLTLCTNLKSFGAQLEISFKGF